MSHTVLVTGATGFVGANVARYLLEQDLEVRALVRPGSDRRNLPEHPGFHAVEGDLRDAASVRRAIAGCTEVFHVAADYRFWARDPRELYDSNVTGTENLLAAALEAGVGKFIHTSTVGTIGLKHQPEACNEGTPYDPEQFTSHYKRSKRQAEEVALGYARRGLPVVIVNPSAPIGPWDRKPTPTGKIIVDFARGKMPAYVHTGLNFVHVRDVAAGHWLAARRGRLGERYILGNRNLTMREFLEQVAARVGRPAPRARIPYRLAWLAGCVSTGLSAVTGKAPAVPLEAVKMSRRFMFFDADKAVRELGLPQTPIETAIADAVDWFAENGYFGARSTRATSFTPQEAPHGSSP
jgi:dihydroflavonol-4-reductase